MVEQSIEFDDSSPRGTMPSLFGFLAPVVILAVGFAAFRAFGGRDAQERETGAGDTAAPIETVVINEFVESFTIEVDGEATPFRLVTLSAEVPGRISMMSPMSRTGNFVPEGAHLFRIDPTDFEIAVDRLTAQVRQAKAELAGVDIDSAGTQTLIDLAREELAIEARQIARLEGLAERGAASDRDLDAARAQELTKRNALRSLENELLNLAQKKIQLEATRNLAFAQLEQAEADRKRTRVTSPLNSTVVEGYVEQGDYVRVGDPLVRLSDSSRVEVRCSLQADELAWIMMQRSIEPCPGGDRSPLEPPCVRVEVHFDFQGKVLIWDGELSRYGGAGLDPTTRMLDCYVLVDQSQQPQLADERADSQPDIALTALVSGMYVSVHIPIRTGAPLLRIPDVAVRPGGKVWVARERELHIVEIDIAETVGDSVLVRSDPTGLQHGDRVIVSPLPAVENGMPVEEHVTP